MIDNETKGTNGKSLTRKMGLSMALAAALFVAGCQSELYSNLNEREVNEMISVLSANGISASRTSDGKGGFGLAVDRGDFSVAIARLSEKGLPRENFGSLGKVFNSEKLVSTPFEERARFMHALNEELSNSLTRIDGVVSARVHIMVPEASPFEKNRTPPRASVFIYQEKGQDMRHKVPTIKNLIVNSLDNLEYSNVEVALFEDDTVQSTTRALVASGTNVLWNLVLLGILAGLVWFGFNFSKGGTKKRQTASDSKVLSGTVRSEK